MAGVEALVSALHRFIKRVAQQLQETNVRFNCVWSSAPY